MLWISGIHNKMGGAKTNVNAQNKWIFFISSLWWILLDTRILETVQWLLEDSKQQGSITLVRSISEQVTNLIALLQFCLAAWQFGFSWTNCAGLYQDVNTTSLGIETALLDPKWSKKPTPPKLHGVTHNDVEICSATKLDQACLNNI